MSRLITITIRRLADRAANSTLVTKVFALQLARGSITLEVLAILVAHTTVTIYNNIIFLEHKVSIFITNAIINTFSIATTGSKREANASHCDNNK